jgi:SAM-dependent methyltransferase
MTVLDAGVGSGRYARLAARHAQTFVGLDLSLAVERAKKALDGFGNSLVVQGDLMAPPLRPASFDLVYSIGVIHHTPDTKRAFDSLARLVAPGGHLAIWVYRRNSPVQEALNTLVRAYTTRLSHRSLMRLLAPFARLGGLPVLRHLSKLINFSTHPKLAIRYCDTFDWYSPAYQHHHTEAEVAAWFSDAGFEDIRLLEPSKAEDPFYRKMFKRGLIIGSGVNVVARRPKK